MNAHLMWVNLGSHSRQHVLEWLHAPLDLINNLRSLGHTLRFEVVSFCFPLLEDDDL